MKGGRKMTRYTLYTEYKYGLVELVSKYFKSATIHYGIGLWHGNIEHCAMIEIIIDETDKNADIPLDSLVYDIKVINEQETVMVVKDNPIIWYL
jgi:hypothetical protein